MMWHMLVWCRNSAQAPTASATPLALPPRTLPPRTPPVLPITHCTGILLHCFSSRTQPDMPLPLTEWRAARQKWLMATQE